MSNKEEIPDYASKVAKALKRFAALTEQELGVPEYRMIEHIMKLIYIHTGNTAAETELLILEMQRDYDRGEMNE